MVALLHLVLGVLAGAGLALALCLALFPRLKQWPSDLLQRHLFPDANQISLKQGGRTKGGAAAAAQQRNVFRVLCFGDSLTSGFTSGGINFHPYAKRLGDSIYAQMPEGWHLEVEEQGESGERVLFSMKHRLQRTLDEHAEAGRPYDWVLLLGGINDLGGDNSTADEVVEGLSVLAEACLQHGANVLLMTVMEVAQPEARVEEQRLKLNTLIKQYVQQQEWLAAAQGAVTAAMSSSSGSSKQQGGGSSGSSNGPVSRRGAPRVVLFDVASQLTWNGMDEETRWTMWDDRVHLTIDGYDLMGDLIVGALGPLVQQDIGAKAAAAAANGTAAAAGTNGVSDHHKKAL